MVQRRDAGRSDSHQYFPVCDRWFRKIDQLQLLITIKLFRSHCTHMLCPFLFFRLCSWLFSSARALRFSSKAGVVIEFNGVEPCLDVFASFAELPEVFGKPGETLSIAVGPPPLHISRPGFDLPRRPRSFGVGLDPSEDLPVAL